MRGSASGFSVSHCQLPHKTCSAAGKLEFIVAGNHRWHPLSSPRCDCNGRCRTDTGELDAFCFQLPLTLSQHVLTSVSCLPGRHAPLLLWNQGNHSANRPVSHGDTVTC